MGNVGQSGAYEPKGSEPRVATKKCGETLHSPTIVHCMPQLHRRDWRHVPLLLGMAMGMATVGCGERASNRASVDSALNRDLTLAASATSDVTIGDTAVSNAPSTPLPAPEPSRNPPPPSPRPATRPTPTRPAPATQTVSTPSPAPSAPTTPVETAPAAAAPTITETPAAGRGRALGAGVQLSGPTNAEICSLANRPGDRFVVSLASRVTSPDGASLPAGTPVLVEMAPMAANGDFVFRLRGVQVNGEFYPAEGQVQIADGTPSERTVSKGGDKGKVVTGAIIGGILGRVMGGGTKGTIIGAAGGAAAGTVAAARNTTKERCLPAGATLVTTLTAPLMLPSSIP